MKYIDYNDERNLERIKFIVKKNKSIIDESDFFSRRKIVNKLYKIYYRNEGYYSK